VDSLHELSAAAKEKKKKAKKKMGPNQANREATAEGGAEGRVEDCEEDDMFALADIFPNPTSYSIRVVRAEGALVGREGGKAGGKAGGRDGGAEGEGDKLSSCLLTFRLPPPSPYIPPSIPPSFPPATPSSWHLPPLPPRPAIILSHLCDRSETGRSRWNPTVSGYWRRARLFRPRADRSPPKVREGGREGGREGKRGRKRSRMH
jgi:hypothetical protein